MKNLRSNSNHPLGPTASGRSKTATATNNVACDACVLINFLSIDRIEILHEDVSRYRFVVPDAANAEVTRQAQRDRLDAAYREHIVYRAGAESIEELIEFSELTRFMGRGEAACLALAKCRGWMLASDEGKPFRRMAVESIGEHRLIGTADIFDAAIENKRMTVSEADDLKASLEDTYHFKMPFKSFAEREHPASTWRRS